MAGQQLVAALCCRLSDPAEGSASKACLPWGVGPPLRSDVVPDPLRGGPGSTLGGSSREVGEASLPSNLVLDVENSAPGGLLGHLVRLLVARDPRVGWDLVDSHLVAAGHQARGDLGDRPSPTLTWAQDAGSCSLNGGVIVREDRKASP